VWSLPETESWAEDLNLVLVRDLTQQPAPPGPNIYTRLLPFGTGARISQHAMETLASRLEGHDVAYVVVVGQGAKSTRNTLRDWFELGDE
jgi:hypothetical protein